ncbi:hypothetical protein J7E97_08140 [Streptomyces sp. ISL-66]|uniref:hypothetical protein n=1 Tax=Streptomyces sp. ISL-66 TaxID=2819186 RepID=UPI001BE85E3B|nr:hypothetical protein [Streptomyces sp. ISL-66]MBT2467843.1 hypothetical protein [Streptomyces sp. ISL-66]
MARLQILELPEGAEDARAPFVLVVDQCMPQRVVLGAGQGALVDHWQALADRIGARGVVVTPETVEIPANEVSIGPDGYPVRMRVEADFTRFDEQLAERAAADAAPDRPADAVEAKLRHFIDEHHERDIRLMDRVTNALGIDRLRNWDEIVWAIENDHEVARARRGSIEDAKGVS